MTGGVDEMQKIVVAFVVVYHTAGLGLDGDTTLALDIQLIQDLLVTAGLNGAGELEQSVAESALAMIDVSDDAEVAESLNRDGGDAFFEVRLGSMGDGVAGGGGAKGAQPCGGRGREEFGGTASKRALQRPPKAFSGPEAWSHEYQQVAVASAKLWFG